MSKEWNFKQELVAVFGKPIAENPAQYMIEKAFAHHGLDWRYLSLEVEPEDLADAARAFADAGVKRAIISKLDVTRRRGGVVAALASAGISFAHLGVTPFIGGGLVPATPARPSKILLEEASVDFALRGAA